MSADENNVIQFKAKTSDAEDHEIKAIRAFNALYAEYLKIRSKVTAPASGECADRLCDKLNDLTWRIVRTPAPLPYHLNYKFEVMREIIDAGFVDGRHLALLESIRNDMLDGANL